VVLKESSLK